MSEKQTPENTLNPAQSAVSKTAAEASVSGTNKSEQNAPATGSAKDKAAADNKAKATASTKKTTAAPAPNQVKSKIDSHADSQKITDDEKAMGQSNSNQKTEKTAPTAPVKSGGKGLSLLAILIALGIGAGGYFWGTQQLTAVQQQVTALSDELAKLQNQAPQSTSAVQPTTPNNSEQDNSEAIKTALQGQLTELQNAQTSALQQTQREIQQLSAALDLQKSENSELRNQLNKLSFNNKADPNDWLMSEADFLLTNAQRKLVLDNDIDTVITLLQEANQTLQQVSTSQALSIRTAISNDLTQLQNVNDVDQDLIMSQLSLLVSQVDNLKVLALNPANNTNIEVSDSINDWQQNLEKSASSFLSHFIQVRKKDPNRPEFLAPDQDIFLKENIRLSLQVALSAVPRQQNEVYKQSLNSVASWVRSYFDTDDYSVQQFLQQVDQLKDQSIYVNAPQQLSSWQAIGTLLNRDHRTLGQFSTAEAEKAEIEKAKAAEEQTAQTKTEQENTTVEQPVSTETEKPIETPAEATNNESTTSESAVSNSNNGDTTSPEPLSAQPSVQ